jgi:methionyl-tRNA formyltransferase
MSLRIVFMGTPDFSVPALEAIHGAGHDVLAVYSQPPRPAGRGLA